MLTGLMAPDVTSEGGARVYGSDLLTSMSSIRQRMGVCPQHDVLFDNLNIKDTIMFFSQLKVRRSPIGITSLAIALDTAYVVLACVSCLYFNSRVLLTKKHFKKLIRCLRCFTSPAAWITMGLNYPVVRDANYPSRLLFAEALSSLCWMNLLQVFAHRMSF